MALAVQADGKILVGGFFTTLGGGGFGATSRNHIGRLNADGTLDASFNPGANDTVWALALQADGKILVGGDFTMLGGGGSGTTSRNHIGRLNADGSVDSSFDPGANGPVGCIVVQADGKILLGVLDNSQSGGVTTHGAIVRLERDGSLDHSFDSAVLSRAPNPPWVSAIAVQADGKILIGGTFISLGGEGGATIQRNRVGRLNADGSADSGFDTGTTFVGFNNIYNITIQPDGKILISGLFLAAGNTPLNGLYRLNADGSRDMTFNADVRGNPMALALQTDGKIVVGGAFDLWDNGTVPLRHQLARVNADGSLDAGFGSGADNTGVGALVLRADGTLLVGGASR